MTPAEARAVELWGKSFFPFQKRWIGETARFALWIKARQIGGSHATAAACVCGALLRDRPQILLSASQDLSDEVLEKVRAHCHVLAKLGFARATEWTADNASEVRWSGHGRIVALPANPRTARSYTGDVWLDEFAYHSDAELIREAAFPIATRGNWNVRVLSTPNGAIGLFHELAARAPAGWSVHRTTVYDAIRDGLRIDMDHLRSLTGGDARLFSQWYECAFLDAELQYLPTALVEQAFQPEKLPDLSRARIHAGLDVGREHDLTALQIVAEANGHLHRIGERTCKRTDFRAQRRMIDEARRAYRWDTLHVDETGLGSQLAEELVADYGAREVVPVTFTPQRKEKMATGVHARLAGGRLHLAHDPESDRALRADMVALRRTVSQTGNVAYEVPRTAHGHGDRFWSLALSLLGTEIPPVPRGVFTRPVVPVS